MENSSEHSSIAELIEALRSAKIRFMIAGMSAAVLQGVPATTFDTDIWIDLPPRQYMRVINLAIRLGAELHANTVVVFPDDTIVNFLFTVNGLKSFRTERKGSVLISWFKKRKVPVLSLEQILRSKRFIQRPKDLAHIPLLEKVIEAGQRMSEGVSKSKSPLLRKPAKHK